MRRRRDLRIAQSCTALRTLATRLFAAWPPTRRCVNSSNSPYCALTYGPKRSFRGYHGLRRGTCSTKLAHVHAGHADWSFTCTRFFVSKPQNPSSRASQGARFGARELLVRVKSSRAPKTASKMKNTSWRHHTGCGRRARERCPDAKGLRRPSPSGQWKLYARIIGEQSSP